MLAKALQSAALATQPLYIEDVFSTYLYTGNGSTQTITNEIDLAGEGGLVWQKIRAGGTQSHYLFDTNRGAGLGLRTNGDFAEFNYTGFNYAFNNSGFSFNTSDAAINGNTNTYASWTFRKAPKFFDVVTYTGNGTGTNIGGGVLQRDIAHNLNAAPGCVIIKNLSTGNWVAYHRSLGSGGNLRLNTTDASFAPSGIPPIYLVSSTTFSVVVNVTGTSSNDNCNLNGNSYVAYLFAHDAGGFGDDGTENVISCGSYTGSNTNPAVITLGYEPQWVLIKGASGTAAGNNWVMYDTMRGMPNGSSAARLWPNLNNAESVATQIFPTSTGFTVASTGTAEINFDSTTYIYIAIRRGPMKTPTTGTEVFSPLAYPGLVAGSGNSTKTAGFPVDLIWARRRNYTVNFGASNSTTGVLTRLTGGLTSSSTTITTPIMATLSSDAETTQNTGIFAANNTGFVVTANTGGLAVDTGSGETYIAECFRRAPGFFDVVCYTGTGSARTVAHNLGVVPELMIVKNRVNGTQRWRVYVSSLGATKYLELNTTNAEQTWVGMWNNTAPTATVFTVGSDQSVNESGSGHIAYLFATLPGVSKVGSYTGNGTSQTIDCGFTTGARFVLIKRTDNTGDWYVWDSARGIVAGNDPHLSLNTTAAEVTTDDSVDADTGGFIVNQDAATNVNVNSATYICLAIA
jgi:hypothetical protein